MSRLPAVLVAVSLAAAQAHAGVVMEMVDKPAGAGRTPATTKISAAADRVRVEAQGQVVIFRGDKQVLWAIDPQAKTYMELTKDAMAGMADAMKEMQAALAGMSAEERKMVEGMMKGQMGGMGAAPAPVEPLTWRGNGTEDRLIDHACRGYDGVVGGKVTQVICAAEWATFGLSPEDFSGFQAFGAFMKEMTGPMASMAGQMKASIPDAEMPGVPLRTVVKSPQGDDVHEVTRLEKSAIDPALFDLPSGLAKQSMEDMGGAPPRRR